MPEPLPTLGELGEPTLEEVVTTIDDKGNSTIVEITKDECPVTGRETLLARSFPHFHHSLYCTLSIKTT